MNSLFREAVKSLAAAAGGTIQRVSPYSSPMIRLAMLLDSLQTQVVLEGAGDYLNTIAGIQLELSLVELYTGQSLMQAQVEFLAAHGLNLWSVDRGFMDGKTGRLLQCDGTFVRESAVPRR